MPMVTGTKKKWKIVVTPNCRRASSSEVMRRIFEGTAPIAIGGGHASASVVVRDAPGAARPRHQRGGAGGPAGRATAGGAGTSAGPGAGTPPAGGGGTGWAEPAAPPPPARRLGAGPPAAG